jgi:hypothetical protein
MKTFALIALGAAAVSVAACVPPRPHRDPLKPLARLDCPQDHGNFHLSGAAADGRSCDYAGSDGSKVQVKLVSFSGDADSVLAPVEAQMKTLLPAPPAVPASNPPPSSASPGKDKDRDNVNIDLPGISIHADDKNANVHVGGVHIDADGENNSAHITGGHGGRGQFTVDANDNGAVVRARSFGGPNIEESWIWASKTPGPDGWRSVGYEALGPKSGPLVVASFQSKTDEHDNVFEDVKGLARRAARG